MNAAATMSDAPWLAEKPALVDTPHVERFTTVLGRAFLGLLQIHLARPTVRLPDAGLLWRATDGLSSARCEPYIVQSAIEPRRLLFMRALVNFDDADDLELAARQSGLLGEDDWASTPSWTMELIALPTEFGRFGAYVADVARVFECRGCEVDVTPPLPAHALVDSPSFGRDLYVCTKTAWKLLEEHVWRDAVGPSNALLMALPRKRRSARR